MTNPKSPDKPNKYFFMDDATRVVYYSDSMADSQGYVYVGTSNNPNLKMAMAAFLQTGKVTSGYTLRDFNS